MARPRRGGEVEARPWRVVFIALLVLAGLSVPAAAMAQSVVPELATPFLPADHWALGAARRLEAAGLAPEGFGGGSRSRTQREIAALFERAELQAELHAPELAALARAYRLRFAEEFRWTMDVDLLHEAESSLQGLGAQLRVGYEESRGRVLTGVGYDSETDWTGALPVPDWRGSASALAVSLALPPFLALSVSPAYRADDWVLDEGHLTAILGSVGLWAGRRAVGFHPGAGGGIVLSGGRYFDGGGLFLDDPVHLPGWLSYVGPVRFELLLSRIENGDRIEYPWFGALHGSLHPHPRVELGFTRGNIFGGKGNSPTTFRSMVQMFFGFHAGERGEYNNEVFAVDLRLRPPVGTLPLSLYAEWGMDDSAGAWRNVPARVIGAELAALPRLPQVALGVERTTFAGACCGNTIWYRNWSLRGGWAADGQPLGHPLAGHGSEWLAFGRADLFDARLQVDLQLFTRDRGEENLLAPERLGRSRGGRLELEGRLGPGLGVFFQGLLEDGRAGWRESVVRVGGQLNF